MSEASSSSAAAPASAPAPAPELDPEAIALMADEAPPEEMTLVLKWNGKEYTVRAMGDDTLLEFKRRICEATDVLPKRQRLLYPKLMLNDDSVLLCSIPFKRNLKITMIGTVEEEIFVDQPDDPDVVDDHELLKSGFTAIKDNEIKGSPVHVAPACAGSGEGSDHFGSFVRSFSLHFCKRLFPGLEPMTSWSQGNSSTAAPRLPFIKDNEIYKKKLKRRASRYKLKLLNPCREGKRLLVLDIDYTLFDHKSPAENPLELMRPHLHEFLTAAYAEYDIMIWSATSMKWVQWKMEQLGVLSNPNYKITALMDHLAMITVQSDKYYQNKIFDCKPLGIIWTKFPEYYNEKNTIMFDDLRRNFVMNPQNGLVIRPYSKASKNRSRDRELVHLTQYLLAIAELGDFSKLDHDDWESFMEGNGKRRRHR